MKWWKKSPRYPKLKHIDPSMPSNKFLKITSTLTHKQSSILTQLRTGHVPLNKYLHKIRKTHSPLCPQTGCIYATEDIRHFIFACPAYTHARHTLARKLGKKALSSPNLLANEDFIQHTLTYLNNTERFKGNFGNIMFDQ